MKVAKLIVVQILGFVEDERTFKTLTFMKIKLWDKFSDHLDFMVHMFAIDSTLFQFLSLQRCHHNLDQ